MAGGLALQLEFGDDVLRAVGRVLALGGVSLFVSGVAAAAYRWYTRERLPGGLAVLLGVGAVGVSLNATGVFQQALGGTSDLFSLGTVIKNVLTLLVATLATPVGRRVGDGVATDVFAISGAREIEAEVGRLVRTVGRVTAVELPEEIDDMEGYDPVEASVKERLAGTTLLFPRRLTVAELTDRLATRIKDDYDVGYVDVEVDEDGDVTYLALGTRVTGIGPTLGPGTAAVAVRADPPNSASPGDVVQVWELEADEGDADAGTDGDGAEADPGATATTQTPPTAKRVLTAELRATAEDVVTLAVDESETDRIDPETTYRLVTLPAEPRADREFASLLRAADETLGVITVDPASELVGRPVGDVGATVAAVRPAGAPIEAIPRRGAEIAGGDVLYVVARPETLRRLELEAAASPTEGGETDGGDETASASSQET